MAEPRSHSGVTIGVMARAPIAGRCKTRLATTLGPEGAARLYAAMLADRLAAIDALPAARRILLAAPEDDGVAVLGRIAPTGWVILEQRGADLGARLGNAFRDLIGHGGLVCLVDSDSPLVSFAGLWPELARPRGSRTVVAGPCEDGGYYLIGMTSLETEILDGIPWSTSGVMTKTRSASCTASSMSCVTNKIVLRSVCQIRIKSARILSRVMKSSAPNGSSM